MFGIWPHTDIHTHASSNAVTLVWGSLRLTPINIVLLCSYVIDACVQILWGDVGGGGGEGGGSIASRDSLSMICLLFLFVNFHKHKNKCLYVHFYT